LEILGDASGLFKVIEGDILRKDFELALVNTRGVYRTYFELYCNFESVG
jgi:hypothetical protein